MTKEPFIALVALILLVSAAVPAAGVLGDTQPAATQTDERNATNGVNVTIGQQLSTVVAATDGEVRSTVEETAFELRFEAASDNERAEVVADRAEELARRAIEIRADYRNATRAHEAGEMSDSEYAERIAALNARAEDLAESVHRLRGRATGLSALELRSAGFTAADLRAIDERLDAVSGTGAAALLQRFTGRSDGEIEIRTRDGLTIVVESEDGELSREIERPRDDILNITVSQSDALETARAQLGTPRVGEWTLRRASVHEDSGYYRFEFALTDADATGEAEVRVDGSSGEVFRLETEIERPEDDDEERDDETDDDRDELALLVDAGTPGPNETVTLLALERGHPVANATVTLNGDRVGTTDADGRIEVRLPDDEAELRVESGQAEGELEFEFDEDDRADRELRRLFDVDATLADGNLTITLRYNGDPVENVTVTVEGRQVGTTDEDGQVTAELGSREHDEYEVKLRRGALAVALELKHEDGGLTVVETEFETDERDDDEDDEREDEGVETEDPEEERETESDDDSEDAELSVSIAEGDPAPGATVTVAVTADGNPIEGAVITVNDERVGQTAANGRLEVTLPETERVEITAESSDEDAELEFEFDDEETTEREEDTDRERNESDDEETDGGDDGRD